jgi:prepilin-type N-terminal cleavage/methylation domain-containing protein
MHTPPIHNPIRRGGLTLVELLVTLAIIAAMILAFSMILSSSQKVVSSSQAMMRSNAAAEAIARTIRLDFQYITKDGFLAIRDGHLVFTTAGLFPIGQAGSLSDDDENIDRKASGIGTGQTITYGLANNPADEDNMSNSVLFRRVFVLDGEYLGSGDLPLDVWNIYLSRMLRWSQADLETEVDNLIADAPETIRIPPHNTFASAQKLRMVMNHRVSDLTIEWASQTDAQGNLVWRDDDQVWSHHNRSDWPLAVRIRFKILDEALPEEFHEDSLVYEVVCGIES